MKYSTVCLKMVSFNVLGVVCSPVQVLSYQVEKCVCCGCDQVFQASFLSKNLLWTEEHTNPLGRICSSKLLKLIVFFGEIGLKKSFLLRYLIIFLRSAYWLCHFVQLRPNQISTLIYIDPLAKNYAFLLFQISIVQFCKIKSFVWNQVLKWFSS